MLLIFKPQKIGERNHLLDLCLDGRKLLQHILNKQEINVLTLFTGYLGGKIGGCYNYDVGRVAQSV
jgi:hypothetical protein